MTKTAIALTALTRRLVLGSTAGGVAVYSTYKAHYDPIHLVWDLDNTLLCSVTPIPRDSSTSASTRINDFLVYDSFDQIDDDFPSDAIANNTRTYWRPGARTALKLCSLFAVQHIYTTAQGTYTENILKQLDKNGINRSVFHTIIHRGIAPASVKNGKDLRLIVEDIDNKKRGRQQESSLLHRMILFDDRTNNFTPQEGRNGAHVLSFDVAVVNKEPNDVADDNNNATTLVPITFIDWWREGTEVARLVAISMLAFWIPGDVRDTVLPMVRTQQHKERFPTTGK